MQQNRLSPPGGRRGLQTCGMSMESKRWWMLWYVLLPWKVVAREGLKFRNIVFYFVTVACI
jgi:hypothetical protein